MRVSPTLARSMQEFGPALPTVIFQSPRARAEESYTSVPPESWRSQSRLPQSRLHFAAIHCYRCGSFPDHRMSVREKNSSRSSLRDRSRPVPAAPHCHQFRHPPPPPRKAEMRTASNLRRGMHHRKRMNPRRILQRPVKEFERTSKRKIRIFRPQHGRRNRREVLGHNYGRRLSRARRSRILGVWRRM